MVILVLKHITDKVQSFILSLVFILNLFVPAFNAFAVNESVPNATTEFKFNENSVSVSDSNGESYTSDKTSLTISKPGVYKLTGTCKNGQITIDENASGSTLVLENFNFISDSDITPFVLNGSTNLFLVGSNKISCTSENLVGSAISLGEGVNLSIDGINFLEISGFPVGISGLQDFVGDSRAPSFHMMGGCLRCYTEGSAISVENVNLSRGSIEVKKGETAVYCKTLNILGGNLDCTCNSNCVDAQDINITGGDVALRSSNRNGLNSSNNINISGSSYLYAKSGDKAIHADNELKIGDNNGSNPHMDIYDVEEGLEAARVYLYSGSANITTNDDGINAANKKLGKDDLSIEINGGQWNIDAGGDGIDSNGSITMNGGNITVFGSEKNDDSAVDYETTFTVNGGKILAVGMANMAMLPTSGDYVSFGKSENRNNVKTLSPSAERIVDNENQTLFMDGNEIFDKIYSEVNKDISKWMVEKPKLFSFLYKKYEAFSDSDKKTISSYLEEGDTGIPKLKKFLVEKYDSASYEDRKLLNDYVSGNIEPIDRYSPQDGSSISIKAGDVITIKDSKGNVVASNTAKKSADHVLFAKTDPNETYSLFISSWDNPNDAKSTSSDLDVSADYWLENGKTCTFVRHKYKENFLLEDSDGTKAWYGIRDPNCVLEEGSIFHVQWFNSAKISENERDRYYKIYEKLDDSLKDKAKNGKLWLFDMGVRKLDGTEYGTLDNFVYVDIELGDDWSTNDLSVVCVTESNDEKIQYKVLENSVYVPSETGGKKYLDAVARLTINHFSPYALVEDGLAGGYSTGDKCSIVFMALELIAISSAAFMIFNRKSISLSE